MFASAQSPRATRIVAGLTLVALSLTGIVAPVSVANAGDAPFKPGLVGPVKPMVPGTPGKFTSGGGGGGSGGDEPKPAGDPVVGKGQQGHGELIAAGIIGLAAGAILSGAMSQSAKPAATTQLPGWWIAECAKRHVSYNPGDNTFLGDDGYRHACDPR